MSTEIANRSTGFVTTMEEDTLLEIIPFMRLAHPLSQVVIDEVAKAGEYYIEGYDSLKEFTFVPLGVQSRRTLWGEGVVNCRSFDGVMGEGEPGGECAVCPFSKNNMCQPSRLFVGVVREWNCCVFWDLKGSGLKMARQIKTWNMQFGKLGTWAMSVSSRQVKGKKGTYYEATARFIG